MSMTRTELCRRLHDMVDQLMEMPLDWFQEGIYPMMRLAFVDKETGDAVTLVVGIETGEPV